MDGAKLLEQAIPRRGSADLQFLHVPHSLGEILVFTATMNFRGHHIAGRRAARIEVVLRQPFADDVAVGHHSDKAVVLANWDSAYIAVCINLASSGTGVSGLTQSTPLCIASLTFTEGPSLLEATYISKCSFSPLPSNGIIQELARKKPLQTTSILGEAGKLSTVMVYQCARR
jgi:hypothetical protein